MSDYTSDGSDADEPSTSCGYRSYEVYQRERVGETTNRVTPRDLITSDYLADPFTVPGVLRENYPCFRDWAGNRFWLTRYDDVTSVFVDDANFENRPRRSAYGAAVTGTDMGAEPRVHQAWVELHDAALERAVATVLDGLSDTADLATDFTERMQVVLLDLVVGLGDQTGEVLSLVTRMKAGTGWDERARIDGLAASRDLRQVLAPLLADRRERPAGDLISVLVDLGAASDDVAVTLLEMDLETLPASVSNLWCLLLAEPEQFAAVKTESRLMKLAYLEALRHSPPIATADRFVRHEVERFGRLLPEGAMVHLSASAANRDPRQFVDPDVFDMERKDLSRREPRGQFRADGLPAAITFGHGKPSGLPAVPRDAPRSGYALTRDIAVKASLSLLERFPDVGLTSDANPSMSLDRLGGTYRCRSLPVTLT